MAQIEVKRLSGVDPAQLSRIEAVTEAIRRDMSPKGKLGLPKLLDKRRLDNDIPDSAFKQQALFERIFVWQIPDDHGLLSKDSPLVLPETLRHADKYSTPRGIIVSAGLSALDIMHSNGIELGAIVSFQRIAPFRRRIGRYAGEEFELIVLNLGDLTGCEDLADDLRDGQLKLVSDDGEHKIADKNGKARAAKPVWVPPDME